MYAVFCGVHIVVLIGVFVLFLLCVRNTASAARLCVHADLLFAVHSDFRNVP